MGKITKQQIIAMAPNSNAVANARKLSANGSFSRLSRTEDETFYMGECKGSGKSSYSVSADFIEGGDPVCRCSCPSRQHPCKHSLGLLFEIEEGKQFSVCPLPEEIKEKRERKEKRAAKSAEKSAEAQTGAKKETAKKKSGQTARLKKMKKQLEGLSVVRKLTDRLLASGLGTLSGTSLKTYKDLSKQLGDYYLPGPQILLNRVILESEEYQKDGESDHQEQVFRLLIRMNSLLNKSETYLKEKLEKEDGEDDDNILYEELGGIWNLERLNQLGRCRQDAKLVQLSFEVFFDGGRKEYIDRGYYVDCEEGQIVTTVNYRPVKALKYVKQEDSSFGLLNIPMLITYPGNVNPRVRWEKAEFHPLGPDILERIRKFAEPDLENLVKQVKNQIKNPLDPQEAAVMAAYRKIGRIRSGENTEYVLEDPKGQRILLRDQREAEKTTEMLARLWAPELIQDQVLFGKMFYDQKDHRICMQPFSIITGQAIVRLGC